MGKGDHNRDPSRAVSGEEYRKKYGALECPRGGFHDRGEDGTVCLKCGDPGDIHPDLPPGLDVEGVPV